MADSILNTIEKISGEKISRTEEQKETKPKKRRGNPEALKKMHADIKAGKRPPLPKPWSKKKAKKEKPKEESKPEIKLEKKSPEKEAEEMKKGLDVTDAEFLKKKEKPIIEPKEIKREESKEDFDANWLIYGIAGLVVVFLLMQVFKKSSPPTPPSIPKTKSKIRQFDIGGGRIIEIPV